MGERSEGVGGKKIMTSVCGKVKLDGGGLHLAPKIQVKKPEDFADFEKVYKDFEQKYGAFGIIGVKPPRGMAPPPMNFPRDGVNAWGRFADIKCIDEISEIIPWRINKEPEEGELMEETEAIAILDNLDAGAITPAEFTRRAKKDGFFEPFSRNIDECCELFWSWMQNIRHTTYDAAKKCQPSNAPRYATSIDGSFVKILARQAKVGCSFFHKYKFPCSVHSLFNHLLLIVIHFLSWLKNKLQLRRGACQLNEVLNIRKKLLSFFFIF